MLVTQASTQNYLRDILKHGHERGIFLGYWAMIFFVIHSPISGNKCGIIPGKVLLKSVASVAKLQNAPAHRTPWGW